MSADEGNFIHADKALVRQIKTGNDDAWGQFVSKYTDWVFYQANKWTQREARFSREAWRKIRSAATNKEYEYSEEALDAYIWIFDQLRKKLPGYTGEKGASLSAYIWAVLNSKFLFVDFLRYRYSNPHYLPPVIQKCTQKEQKVFSMLRMQKSEQKIANAAKIDLDQVVQIKEKLIRELVKVGQEDLLLKPVETELTDLLTNMLHDEIPISGEEHLLLDNIIERFSTSQQKLPPDEIRLLQLFYNEDLDAKGILSLYQKIDLDLPIKKKIHDSTSKDVYKAIENIKNRLVGLFQKECADLGDVIITPSAVNTFLTQLGVTYA